MRPALLALSVALAAQASYPPAFPRPNATKLLENDRIVVWDIVWPSGQPTPMHRHVHDQVGTYYQRGGRRITPLEGEPRSAMTEAGSLSNTLKGTTHIEEGTTDPPLRAVFIELKSTTPLSTNASPEAALPAGVKTLRDDERVRVWEKRWEHEAEKKESVRRYAYDTVTVWLDAGELAIGPPGGAEAVVVKAGTMRFDTRGSTRVEARRSGAPRAMVFEIK